MSLTANIRYEKLASAFENFKGYHAETAEEIRAALTSALRETGRPSIINIAINPSADRKAQVCLQF
jgi:thiamine pyrophosphate-dependent acetolactate synthase large subunit-like protein